MAAETSEQQQPKEEDNLILPPGFRFHPTDEEIITCYLSEKIADRSFTAVAMGEVDLNKCEPWDLPKKAKMGEKAWYFFSQKERRYPTGMRTNRATESGYWKATGKDKEIRKGKGSASVLVGMKKTLVFYKGRAPRGQKTNWVMHEFRREGSCSSYFSVPTSSSSSKDDWVVVRVFHKNDASKKTPLSTATECDSTVNNNQSCSFFPHSGSSSFGYLHQCSPFVGQYREREQFSNSTASISRDTRLSNDWNADISSYDHQDGPSSSPGPLFDLENIWNY